MFPFQLEFDQAGNFQLLLGFVHSLSGQPDAVVFLINQEILAIFEVDTFLLGIDFIFIGNDFTF